jgi:hypothetical protein
MAVKKPTLTVYEAWQRRIANDYKDFVHDGFHYGFDGPMMSPQEAWGPIANFEADDPDIDNTWFAEGEAGDPITESSQWVQA